MILSRHRSEIHKEHVDKKDVILKNTEIFSVARPESAKKANNFHHAHVHGIHAPCMRLSDTNRIYEETTNSDHEIRRFLRLQANVVSTLFNTVFDNYTEVMTIT
jgi:hypothetical protein